MNLERVEKIAEAVLYEGYMLYPYRPSSVKNRQRWNFGVLFPRSYCEREKGSDSWMTQTECLLGAGSSTRLTVKVRFLQIVQRSVGKLRRVGQETPEGVEPEFDLVDRFEAGGRIFQPWQEAVERTVTSTALDPSGLSSHPSLRFTFPSGKQFEYLRDENGKAVGTIMRTWELLAGSVQFAGERCPDGTVRVTVRVRNLTMSGPGGDTKRDGALLLSLVSAHTILAVEGGEFVSLLDPPEQLKEQAAKCVNIGTWPVLAGEEGRADTMLSSPIILYDYPQIAPESAGNLFDGTEIDEILSLRILTMTSEEKREMRESDERARAILERTECMPEEQFMKLHGALRGLRPFNKEAQ